MQYNNRGGAGAMTIGAVVGALVAGAAVGLLAAPDSGAGTRRRIRRGLADLGGHTLREHWDDLSTGLERRRTRRAHDAEVERLQARIEELEAQIEEDEAAEAELAEELADETEESGHGLGSVLGLAAGAFLTWFLSSEQAGPARDRAREAAEKAKDRATDEWERFKERRGGYRKTGNRMTPESTPGAGGQAFQ